MREIYDFPTTPNRIKKHVDEFAKILGYERKSERDENENFVNEFIAIESVTSAIGFKLVKVHKDGKTEDIFKNTPPLDVTSFEYFVKGLLVGLKKGVSICATETVNTANTVETKKK